MTRLMSGAATDVGRVRSVNEDRLLESDGLYAVADGMGGHAAGEVAAATAIEALRVSFAQRSAPGLAAAAKAANAAVWDKALADRALRGMGTTLTALALVDDGGVERLAVAHVGDSRAYLLRGRELTRITRDHSLVEEMVRGGEITAAEAAVHPRRNIVTRALGIEPEVEVDLVEVAPRVGDRYLLCSDGLVAEVDDRDVEAVLEETADPAAAARALVDTAARNGGSDNITVVVVDVIEAPEPPSPAPEPVLVTVAALGEEAMGARDRGRRSTLESPGAARSPSAREAPGPGRPAPLVHAGALPGGPRTWLTLRVVAFFAVLVLLAAGAVVAVFFYNNSSYFVGLQGGQVVIEQGRPGGLLWFEPRVVVRTGLSPANVPPAAVPALRSGMQEPSLAAARRYVANLRAEDAALRSATTAVQGGVTSGGNGGG